MATTTTKKTVAKKKLSTLADLSEEMRAAVDRAVRECREQHWCDRFEMIATTVFGIPLAEIRDSDGFNCRGLDRDGYDDEGFDQFGRDREGYDDEGFNKAGYDREGYDRDGINKKGFDRSGKDKYRYDDIGYDVEGFARNGVRFGGTRAWFIRQAAKDPSEFRYDRNYNPRPKPRTTTAKKTVAAKTATALPKKTGTLIKSATAL